MFTLLFHNYRHINGDKRTFNCIVFLLFLFMVAGWHTHVILRFDMIDSPFKIRHEYKLTDWSILDHWLERYDYFNTFQWSWICIATEITKHFFHLIISKISTIRINSSSIRNVRNIINIDRLDNLMNHCENDMSNSVF